VNSVGAGDSAPVVMETHGVKSTVMGDGLMGCPYQEGIDFLADMECRSPQLFSAMKMGFAEMGL
jgi:hypothetical protein